jgi:adenosylcobinamide-GDP ribazoletransferase
MVQILKRFAAALSFVTCLPVLGQRPPSAREMSESMDLSALAKYLSTAGLLIGVILCLGLWLLVHLHSNSILSGAILVITWLCLTNGLHFDGLMDTADGIFSHQPLARTLEIMSDSRVGNYGVMVGIAVLLIKMSSLATLSVPPLYVILLLCPAWARWCASFAMGNFAYVKEKGMGKVWHDSMKYPRDLFIGGIVPLLGTCSCAYFLPNTTCLATLGTIASGIFASFWLARKLGGHTGDTYGAIVELSEAGGLLITALLLR